MFNEKLSTKILFLKKINDEHVSCTKYLLTFTKRTAEHPKTRRQKCADENCVSSKFNRF